MKHKNFIIISDRLIPVYASLVAGLALYVQLHIVIGIHQNFSATASLLFAAIIFSSMAQAILEARSKKQGPPARLQETLAALKIQTNPGYIYIMRRSDGIYKIGRTDDTGRRLSQHKADYGMNFDLARRFVVSDTLAFERLALSITEKYRHKEPGRAELRKMSNGQFRGFVRVFAEYCRQGISL
jgi:predicted GIY-YIG superfamily endonuclease